MQNVRGEVVKGIPEPTAAKDILCKCGHMNSQHHSNECLFLVDPSRAKYCPCRNFIPKDKVNA